MILLYVAGMLDPAESAELRQHLASGCPACAGHYAEAEATLAMLSLSLPAQPARPALKYSILNQARAARSGIARTGSPRAWDRIVLSGAIAAVLAVAFTLAIVDRFWPTPKTLPNDQATIANLQTQLMLAQAQLVAIRQDLRGMQFAELTGSVQPDAVGHVFIDPEMKKWYFFTCGMKPAADGKTYELWLICNNQKIPAGTFNVSDQGTATLLGAVPPIPPGAAVSLAVTDEPMHGPHEQPTGHLQIKGIVE
jgi:anti-sigma-K factor RskA